MKPFHHIPSEPIRISCLNSSPHLVIFCFINIDNSSSVEFENLEFIHFACTSEDINNLSHALMLQRSREEVMLPALDQVIARLAAIAHDHAELAMLAHTHGQPAS
ncbi:MAG: hypothetical protein C4550_03580, partial [Nitrospiraceae bacterium]